MPDETSVTVEEMARRRGAARALEDVRSAPPQVRWPVGIGSIEAQAQIALSSPDVDARRTLADIAELCRATRGAA